ncbi:MAG: ATPase [Streptomyces sp.]|nr:ATPase [Streptomyces sp.]
MTDPLVLGADLGGTSTRVLVAALDGRPVGWGAAGGGNPLSHPGVAAGELEKALALALAGVDAARVVSAVVGTAGGASSGDRGDEGFFGRLWAKALPSCVPRHCSDLEVAFASGTPAPHGTVLVAGTGAAAGVVRDHVVVRSFDGHGWLLGDDGAGFWLGRQGLRATLRALDAREPLGVLGARIVESLLGEGPHPSGEALREELILAAYAGPPVRLAGLSRAVGSARDAGDTEATDIMGRATQLLSSLALRAQEAGGDAAAPLVLAGGVVAALSQMGHGLRAALAGHDLHIARDGLGGATWLALHTLDPALATEEAHRLLTTAPTWPVSGNSPPDG